MDSAAIEIPEKLKRPEFRFIRLRSAGKDDSKLPMDKKWQEENNFTFDSPEILNHLSIPKNYGVATGYGNLAVLDCDQVEDCNKNVITGDDGKPIKNPLIDLIENNLPETFRVDTPKGCFHSYFLIPDLDSKIIFETGKKGTPEYRHYGELQWKGQQVVGASSIHPSGKPYIVSKDLPIATIEKANVRALFSKYINTEEEAKSHKAEKAISLRPAFDPFKDDIKQRIKVSDVLRHYGVDTQKNPTACPLGHASQSGKCLSFDDKEKGGVWHCFSDRCGKCGDIFTLVMEKEGVSFQEAMKILGDMAGIRRENYPAPVINKPIEAPEVAAFKIREEMFAAFEDAGDDRALKGKAIAHAISQIVHYLIKKYHFRTLADKGKNPDILAYEDGIYIPEGHTIIMKFAEDVMCMIAKNSTIQEIIGHIVRKTIKKSLEFSTDEVDPNLICIENGIFNLETQELIPHTPGHIFFSKLPIKYDPDATCPKIEKFMTQILPDGDSQHTIYEELGYCIYRQMPIKFLGIWRGKQNTGKTQVINLFHKFLGPRNITSQSLQTLATKEFALAELFGKLANIHGDIGGEKIKENDTLKIITGGDGALTVNRKYKAALTMIPYQKQIYGSNNPPVFQNFDGAMAVRVITTEFNVQFFDDEEFEKVKGRIPNAHPAVNDIINKIATPEELSGLFNKVAPILKELIKRGQFKYRQSADDTKKSYQMASDSVSEFFHTYCEEATHEFFIDKEEFRSRYHRWSKFKKYPSSANEKSITITLDDNFGVSPGRKVLSTGEPQTPVYFNLKWKDEFDKIKDFNKSIQITGQQPIGTKTMQEIQEEEALRIANRRTAEERFTQILKAAGNDGLAEAVLLVAFPDYGEELIRTFSNSGRISEYKPDTYRFVK